ncbi:hypothetical protein [Myroides marinus]|uniref:hypothetical protein n=1 Tax=Myroides marinus TaxID=703342 RepID=UPI00257758A9|nr:hypothetical protein [Myroides marinus]MDM1370423.1 hypothetical protein [Myroides marinus]
MRKLFYLLPFFFTFLITSCSNDDNSNHKDNKNDIHFIIKKFSDEPKTVDIILTYGYYNREDNKTVVNKVTLKDFKGYTTPVFRTDQAYAFATVEKLSDEKNDVFILIDSYINNRVFAGKGSTRDTIQTNIDIQHFVDMAKKQSQQ